MKTVCIYHSIDLDGWMSAAIVKHWFNNDRDGIDEKYNVNLNGNKKTINGQDYYINFIGWNYGDPVPDLSEYNRVIMCDISFPKEEMDKLYNRLQSDFVWIDHHISAIKEWNMDTFLPTGMQDVKYAACELTWEYFFPNEDMPEIVRLLGRYDCFGHKGTDEEQIVLEFQYGARASISNYQEAYNILASDHLETYESNIYTRGQGIYLYLCTEAKQTYKNGFEIVLTEPVEVHSSLQSRPRKFICFNRERFNPINFGIDYHKDGYDGAACFHYANGMWNFSLYNDNGEIDCSAIAKRFGGGGHKGAAGFRVENIEKFFKGLN